MASSKVMKSSNTRNSDLSGRASSFSTSTTTNPPRQQLLQQQEQTLLSDESKFDSAMPVDGILRDVYNTKTASTTDATLLDAQITVIDTNEHHRSENEDGTVSGAAVKSVDDVWREIVSGENKEINEEAVDEMMTLEEFLAKTGAVEEEASADVDVKAVPTITEQLSDGVYSFDLASESLFQVEGSIVGFGNEVEVVGGGVSRRGKRGKAILEPLDKAAQQRQQRMIKNRESAARSRERKQAYQVELESLAVMLEEENERLLKEKAERSKERYKQLMEKVVPVVEKRKPSRVLRRVCSMQW